MLNEIIPANAEPMRIFSYNEKQIRTVAIDGEPWFVLKDVCEVLGISKYRDVAERLDEDERGSVRVDTLGGTQLENCTEMAEKVPQERLIPPILALLVTPTDVKDRKLRPHVSRGV